MDFEALATLIRTNPDWETLSDDELAEWCNELAVQRIADRVNSDQLYELIDGANSPISRRNSKMKSGTFSCFSLTPASRPLSVRVPARVWLPSSAPNPPPSPTGGSNYLR